MARMLVVAALSVVMLLVAGGLASSDHDGYAYKWPWYSGTSATVTGLPYQNHHDCEGSCTDAFDLVISDYNVIAGAEGVVTDVEDMIPASECDPADGLGNFIRIEDGNGLTTTYAHLADVNSFLVTVLQGDQVGNQGHTGYTEGNDPGTINGEPYDFCGDHLHWEFGRNNPSNPAHPTLINGEVSNSFATKTSTNELIGGFVASQDVATRLEFADEGAWATVGWLANGGGRGLPIHRAGDGYEQAFQNHDGVGGIYVPDSIGDAFWVRPEFWGLYESLGGPTGFLKHPVDDHLAPCPGGSPSPCDAYQDFECGFIYDDGSSVQPVYVCGYSGLYALTTATTDQYRQLPFGASSWDTITGTGGNSAPHLKTFGNFMVHRTGTGTGGGFRVSVDGGATWNDSAKPTDDTAYRAIDADLCSDGRLWMAWQKSSPTQTNLIRMYYSDDFGQSITLSSQANIGGINAYAAQFDGALSCHPTDPDRVAAIVQRGSSARARVTTTGGSAWSTYTVGSLANAYRIVWAGDRLLALADIGSVVRIYRNDADGAGSWSTVSFSQAGTNRASYVEIIRTSNPDVVFVFAHDPASTQYLLRSLDNGDTWANVGAFPGGTAFRGMIHDPGSDHLYVGRTGGEVKRIPYASTRDWEGVVSADWIDLPDIGSSLALRGLALDGEGVGLTSGP